jgi:hypothetical protein
VSARVLRIELRRSAAVWAALVSLPFVLSYNQVGLGLGTIASSLRHNLAEGFIPLLLGVGAWQAGRDRRSRTEELLATTPRPRWQRALPTAAALAIAAAAGLSLVFAGLAVYAGAVGAYVPVNSLAFTAVTAVYLVAAVWFGLAIGRLLPGRLTPPMLVVAGFATMTAVGILLDDEGGTVPAPGTVLLVPGKGDIGYFAAFSGRVILAQALWAAALAAAGLVLYAAGRHGRLAVVVPVAVGLVAVSPLLPRHAHQAQVLDRGAVAMVCTPDAPRICVTRVHRLTLDGMREPGREALAILSAKLPQAPTAVAELVQDPGTGGPGEPPSQVDTIYTVPMFDDRGRIAVPARDVMWSLLMGAGTQPCDNAPPGPSQERSRYETARLVAAAWLLDEEPLPPTHLPNWWGGLPERSLTLPAYQALRALPAAEQRARVAALREAELACDRRDRLDILTGPGGPA